MTLTSTKLLILFFVPLFTGILWGLAATCLHYGFIHLSLIWLAPCAIILGRGMAELNAYHRRNGR